ncbi:MAG: PhzF family phenazine biosynthesis isomerase [Marinilabiliaceae bacterium]|nr:PhzF family phenazine biosynthesis isomerase [Marinilabiliaceae bacterium]
MTLQKHIKSLFQVDAFTSEAFKGNPAGVVIIDNDTDADFMQKFAAEMNLSETAYISYGNDCFNIRFFTPYSEVPLCGHASLAAAHVLFENDLVKSTDTIKFKTPKYDLSFSKKGDSLVLEFPIYKLEEIKIPGNFNEITGLTPVELYRTEHNWFLAYLSNKTEVHRAHPLVNHMKHSDFGQLIITSKSDKSDDCDFIYRCFAPSLGINEDPVTGSAQCALAPFWRMKSGKTKFFSFQASKRTGYIQSEFINDNTIQITGNAITIFEGKIKI